MSSSKIGDLPGPVKAGGVGGIIGTMMAGAAALFGKWELALILAAGLAAVAAMVAAVYWFRARKAKARSSLLGRAMPGGTPGSISRAESIAKLEALRREFEKGVQKFKDAGRSLYSTPWYVVVGEPGGGKTEAIRHSQVKLITGLQDPLQGVGGTLNMNWWFTRDAIILDTAGKKLFEEVEAGASGEWEEFLNLLKGNRKDCPINGLLLCIPADTLISDTQAQIEKKSGKIAERFEQIQRVLGVRFPVFVIITKCDLIGGFNEFFENLTDLQQNQMLGWSNPAPLNSEFDPKQVEDHLKTVRARLVRRRMRRLIEPTRNEGLDSRRVDQMDALYSLPDNIEALSPRLRQYLETVFVAGAWSQKPLFLRGIYFASSMQEGSPLDLDLANALGIAVNDLPKDETRSEQRTLFLKDLFTEKVFPEKGLVTRVVNVDALQRKRKMILMGGGIAATLAFLILLWTQFSSFNQGLERHRDFFARSAESFSGRDKPVLLESDGQFVGDQIPATLETSQRLVSQKVNAPVLFKPLAKFDDELDRKRREAHEWMIYAMALRPAMDAASIQLTRPDERRWKENQLNARKALQELVRWEAEGIQRTPKSRQEGFDELLQLVMRPADYTAKTDALNKVKSAYATTAADTKRWPTEATGQRLSTIKRGVDLYIKYGRENTLKSTSENLQPLEEVKVALVALESAEGELWNLAFAAPDTEQKYKDRAQAWRDKYKAIADAGARLNAALAAVTKRFNWDGASSLATLYARHAGDVVATEIRDLKELHACIPENAKGDLLACRRQVEDAIKQAEQQGEVLAKSDVQTTLARLTDTYFKPTPILRGAPAAATAKEELAFRVRLDAYQRTDERLKAAEARDWPTAPGARLPALLDEVSAANKTLLEDLDGLVRPGEAPETAASRTRAITRSVSTNLALPYERFRLLRGAIEKHQLSADQWKDYVTLQMAGKDMPRRPEVPMTVLTGKDSFRVEYSPTVVAQAAEIFRVADALVTEGKTSDQAIQIDRAALQASLKDAQSNWDKYLRLYRNYWTDDCLRDLRVVDTTWAEFHKELVPVRYGDVEDGLATLAQQCKEALLAIGDKAEADKIVLRPTPGFGRECEKLLSNWRTLGSDPVQARETFLNTGVDEFARAYTIRADTHGDVLRAYWNNVHLSAMRALGASTVAEVRKTARQLDAFTRFPLAEPQAGPVRDLTAEEIAQARVLFNTVRAGGISAGAKSLAKVNPADIDEEGKELLENIRGQKTLGEPRRIWIESATRLLDALPSDKPMKVSVTWSSKANHNSNSEHLRILRGAAPIDIRQGNSTDKSFNIRGDNDATFDLDLVGPPLTFQFGSFFRGQKEDIKGSAAMPPASQWTVLRLLHDKRIKVTPVADKPNTYEIFVCPDNNPGKGVFFTLKFDETAAAGKITLPRLDNWPKAPKAE